MIVHALQHKMAMKSVLVYDPCILKVVNCKLSSNVVLHALQGWIQGRGNGQPIPSPLLLAGSWKLTSLLTSAIVLPENDKTPITKLNTQEQDKVVLHPPQCLSLKALQDKCCCQNKTMIYVCTCRYSCVRCMVSLLLKQNTCRVSIICSGECHSK